MSITNTIAMLLAFTVVVYATAKKRAVPDSISEIAYIIPHWAFSSWIAIIGILLMPSMMDALPDRLQWVGFLSVAGLMCVAASAYYKTESAVLHYSGGCLCATCATVVTAIVCPALLAAWVLYAVAMAWQKWCCWLFWAEITVFALLIAAMSVCTNMAVV